MAYMIFICIFLCDTNSSDGLREKKMFFFIKSIERKKNGIEKSTSFLLLLHNLRLKCQLDESDQPIVPMIYSGKDRNRVQSLCDQLCITVLPHMHSQFYLKPANIHHECK